MRGGGELRGAQWPGLLRTGRPGDPCPGLGQKPRSLLGGTAGGSSEGVALDPPKAASLESPENKDWGLRPAAPAAPPWDPRKEAAEGAVSVALGTTAAPTSCLGSAASPSPLGSWATAELRLWVGAGWGRRHPGDRGWLGAGSVCAIDPGERRCDQGRAGGRAPAGGSPAWASGPRGGGLGTAAAGSLGLASAFALPAGL